jgi:uncharacterized repeat protein (TIGR03837 family)
MPAFSDIPDLEKFFFLPGFTNKTGGVLREANLIAQREIFLSTQRQAWLTKLAIYPKQGARLISLFSYETSSLLSLVEVWQQSQQAVHCLIPDGKSLRCLNLCLEQNLMVGDLLTLGTLTLQVIPFLSQLDYDRLLWCCDINFVRGEDSFIRAQWAGRPFIWHIYPQEENTHLLKLEAFLHRYLPLTDNPQQEAIRQLWLGWNKGEPVDKLWLNCESLHTSWHQTSHEWMTFLQQQPSLVENLVHFVENNDSALP